MTVCLEVGPPTTHVKHAHLVPFLWTCLGLVHHAPPHVQLARRSQSHAQPAQMHSVEPVNLGLSKQAQELMPVRRAPSVPWDPPSKQQHVQQL